MLECSDVWCVAADAPLFLLFLHVHRRAEVLVEQARRDRSGGRQQVVFDWASLQITSCRRFEVNGLARVLRGDRLLLDLVDDVVQLLVDFVVQRPLLGALHLLLVLHCLLRVRLRRLVLHFILVRLHVLHRTVF